MRAVVTGMIATYPVGGVVWDYGQYALGLEEMGLEVYYLEDTGGPTYDPRVGYYGEDPSYGQAFLPEALATLSPTLAPRWHFRDLNGRTFGIAPEEFEEIVGGADLFLNVSGSCLLRDAYMTARNKTLIDTDPGWNHFVNYPKWDRNPGWQGTHGYRAHDHFFTYAERIGEADCLLPTLGIRWIPTRPPVVLERWGPEPPGSQWTTVMTWNNFRKPVEFDGVTYGTKEREFGKVEELPRHTSASLEVAVGGADPPRERWIRHGWSVVESESISQTAGSYRGYIQKSRGEFSVAKNLYVATGSGWFSCRSVCYLAAGRPVVVQDTGYSRVIPTGEGLFAFSDLDGAVGALRAVESDYDRHQRAAQEIAAEYFGARVVLGRMLRQIGLA
jgi:hypothetical protein